MPTFLQQRLYPTLKLGFAPTAIRSRQREVPIHCRQGDWDGACGFHCAAMALALIGRITDVTYLSRRRRGAAARLWAAAKGAYFNGLDGVDLAALLMSLDGDLLIEHHKGSHEKTLAFTRSHVEKGGLAIAAWCNWDRSVFHWVLVLGLEGLQERGVFTPQALLVMDPSLPEPILCGYNGRLNFTSRPIPRSRRHIEYLTNSGIQIPVTLTEVVAIRR